MQYFVIATSGYVGYVCFYVRCSDCVGVCRNVCCIAGIIKDNGFKPCSGEICCMFV